MSLPPGTRVGAYEITGQLGAGGMGEVYRARDTKLDRDVALKILPPEFARDAERIARFRREAKTLASINHPHIAQIHGLEESADTLALVMELVEGEDLSQRLKRGAIPIDEALPIARQIAEALEAAHEQGIVHRDLKPANIKVTPDGSVKVLDFGLAKAVDQGSGIGDQGSGSANSPTITSPAMTMRGVILGTAAYMAPEQAKGKPVDRRADIWAFGCVLYEMLTGARAFDGDDTTEILGAIVKTEPDWTKLPALTPPQIVSLIKRCLQKDPRRRQQHIGDARLEIDEASGAGALAIPNERRDHRSWVPWSVAALTSTAAFAVLMMGRPAAVPETFPMRVDIATPPISSPQQLVDFAISPDGRHLVYLAGPQSAPLWLRSIETGETRQLPGTDGASQPFWSPDGRSLGFFSPTKLMRLDLGAGAPVSLADVGLPFAADWLPDGTILFGRAPSSPIMRVPASGGTAVAVTALKPGQVAHGLPRHLPDGEHFLYVAVHLDSTKGPLVDLYLGSLSGGEPRLVSSQLSLFAPNIEILPPSWVVYWFDGELRAQHLDVGNAALVGEPVRLAEGVFSYSNAFRGAFDATRTGIVAYRTGGFVRQLAWFDRTGRVLGLVGQQDSSSQVAATVSPDGTQIVLDRTVAGNRDLWLLDNRHALTRLTSEPSEQGAPVWAPDGTRIAFESRRETGVFNLYVRDVDGDGRVEQLQHSTSNQWPLDWSSDGRFLLYLETLDFSNGDLYALPMSGGDRTPVPIAVTSFSEESAAFSPDGRWVAYSTDRSGRDEVVAQSFPDPSRSIQLSLAGGRTPQWSPDGREVFFVAPDGKMMAVPFTATAAAPKVGTPVALFQTQLGDQWGLAPYDVDRNGRFLMDLGNQPAPPIRLLLNWKPGGSN